MKHYIPSISIGILFITILAYQFFPYFFPHPISNSPAATPSGVSTKSKLSPEAYDVMYNAGTERPYTSPLLEEHRKGTYISADTGLPLFRSEDKFESGTGWPSFVKPITPDAVMYVDDKSLGEVRTEVISSDTHAHLGHVFSDGPPDRGGKRYCINGVALKFIPDSSTSIVELN